MEKLKVNDVVVIKRDYGNFVKDGDIGVVVLFADCGASGGGNSKRIEAKSSIGYYHIQTDFGWWEDFLTHEIEKIGEL